MKYNGAVWRPVANVGPPIGQPVLGIVVHVQVGNGSLFGQFNDPTSQTSSHFWIAKDGVVEQYVDTGSQSWAQVAGNLRYLSVETEGYPTEPLTVAQLASLADLIRWGATTYGFPVSMTDHGGQGVTTHAFYPSGLPDPTWGGHLCPGSMRTAQVAALVTPAPPPVPPPVARPPVPITATHKVLISLPTNGEGNAWTPGPLGFPFDRVLAVWISPDLTAGGTSGEAKAGPDGNGTYVEVHGAPKYSVIGVWLTIGDQ